MEERRQRPTERKVLKKITRQEVRAGKPDPAHVLNWRVSNAWDTAVNARRVMTKRKDRPGVPEVVTDNRREILGEMEEVREILSGHPELAKDRESLQERVRYINDTLGEIETFARNHGVIFDGNEE
jgi:hypothetical protein